MPNDDPGYELDIDMTLMLAEYGLGSGSTMMRHRQEAGERAVAAASRITGSDIEGILNDLPDAMEAGGWDPSGEPMRFRVESGAHSNSGREWVLRGALADATIVGRVEGKAPDADAAVAVLAPNPFPEGSVVADASPEGIRITIRYMASGPGASGVSELEGYLSGLARAEPLDD